MKPSLLIILLIVSLTACGTAAPATPAATPTPLLLVTLPPDSTPTATPFQPLPADEIPTPLPQPSPDNPTGIPASETPTASATPPLLDPNALLPGTWTPPAFYNPPYAPAPAVPLTDSDTVTFLLLGSDSRGGQSFRTDTIVLVALRPASGQVTLVSFPRDLWVYIPTIGMERINTAFEYGDLTHYPGGGAALLKDTVLYNLGVRVDHLALVDFNGFRRIVDTLGGLDVPVFCPYTDWHLIDPSYNDQDENNWALFTVGPGVVHMDGDLALWYARSRKKSSDFDRGRRSQEVLRALYAKALQTDAVSKIPQLYNDFSSTITTDLNLTALLELSPLALHLNNADIRSFYLGRDMVTPWKTELGADVLIPNGPAIQAMLQKALAPAARTPEEQALTIEIRNGTLNAGLDALAAQRLNYAGYNTRMAPADRQDYVNTLLYALSATPDPSRDSSLLSVLGLSPSALVYAPMQSDVPYILIVGADYQPCFNPADLAP